MKLLNKILILFLCTDLFSESAIDGLSGLIFLKNYATYQSGDAEYASGSKTSYYTAPRSSTSPATYLNNLGNLVSTIVSDQFRVSQGYRDNTGFHSQPGFFKEGSRTNLLSDSYFADGSSTYWRALGGGTVTTETDRTSPYVSATKVLKFVGTSDGDGFQTAIAKKINVTAGSVYVLSCFVRGSGTVALYMNDGGTIKSSDIILQDNYWQKVSSQLTANNTAASNIGVIQSGAAATSCWVTCIQLEANVFESSYIPTTSASLTRGGELIKYEVSGNRNASTETIIIKYASAFNGTEAAVQYGLLTNDTKDRQLITSTSTDDMIFYPNVTDNAGVIAKDGVPIVKNELCTTTAVAIGATGDPNFKIYRNGTGAVTNNSDWTEPAWGTYFYIGSIRDAGSTFNSRIMGIMIFNRVLSTAEIAIACNSNFMQKICLTMIGD